MVCSLVPLRDSGEQVQGEKRRASVLQFLCLICNRLISLATIPAGQLTNGGGNLKLREKHRLRKRNVSCQKDTVFLSFVPYLLESLIAIHEPASKDINFLGTTCRCYLSARILYFSI